MGPWRPRGFAAHTSGRIATATLSQPHRRNRIVTAVCPIIVLRTATGNIATATMSWCRAASSRLYHSIRLHCHGCIVTAPSPWRRAALLQETLSNIVVAALSRPQCYSVRPHVTALGRIVTTPGPHRYGIRLQCHGRMVTVTSSQAHCHGRIVTVAGPLSLRYGKQQAPSSRPHRDGGESYDYTAALSLQYCQSARAAH